MTAYQAPRWTDEQVAMALFMHATTELSSKVSAPVLDEVLRDPVTYWRAKLSVPDRDKYRDAAVAIRLSIQKDGDIPAEAGLCEVQP